MKKYLLLEKIRFENRLVYSFESTEESLKVPVLCFLIQPFVENAIEKTEQKSINLVLISVRGIIEPFRISRLYYKRIRTKFS